MEIRIIIIAMLMGLFHLSGCAQKSNEPMKFKELTLAEKNVIIDKGTERPYSGKYVDYKNDGTYSCKQCGTSLYRSGDKFDSNCGWPSFDDAIEGAVKRIPDADGRRTEIVCAHCGGHLGHVFEGEGFTSKNTRHCVNSISLEFTPERSRQEAKTETAIFAGGCFWGVEYYMQKQAGVISTTVGYTGGKIKNPTYEEVCSHTSGHIEAIQIIYDPAKTTYEKLARLFFEIHDPTQDNRQGPDVGEQYRSEIFYLDDQQKEVAQKLIGILKAKGYDVVTRIAPATEFYPAENYHQDYYQKNGHTPYCHGYVKRF